MRSVKLSSVLVVLGLSIGMAFVGGCNSQMKDLENRNRIQQDRITDLENQLRAAQIQLDQLKRQLETANATGGVEVETLRQKIAALN